jgi:hypothetical protein
VALSSENTCGRLTATDAVSGARVPRVCPRLAGLCQNRTSCTPSRRTRGRRTRWTGCGAVSGWRRVAKRPRVSRRSRSGYQRRPVRVVRFTGCPRGGGGGGGRSCLHLRRGGTSPGEASGQGRSTRPTRPPRRAEHAPGTGWKHGLDRESGRGIGRRAPAPKMIGLARPRCQNNDKSRAGRMPGGRFQ